MSVYASCWLIPAVVACYVVAGGLRSTFIADYLHTVILFIAIFVFCFLVWATSDVLGSPSRVYDLLVEASEKMPIAGNKDGSYLAFRSVDGLVFAVDLLVAGFCTVWLDQAYWQRAIASRPETSIQAYILGAIAWYGIPFGFATAMGLGELFNCTLTRQRGADKSWKDVLLLPTLHRFQHTQIPSVLLKMVPGCHHQPQLLRFSARAERY